MGTVIDARGLPCPKPVIETRKALHEHGELTVVVDSPSAARNVTRMAEQAGYAVEAEAKDDGTYLRIRRRDHAEEHPCPACEPVRGEGSTVLVVPSECMGRGDDELGSILVRGFFHALGEVESPPATVIFLNSGVKLVVHGSPIIDDLRALCERGVAVLACGTCLGHYGLKEQVAVGEVTNMYAIAQTLLTAGKVVSL